MGGVRTREDLPDQRNQTPTLNGQRGIQRGERVRLGGVRTREDPTRPKGTRPPPQQTERGSERGGGDLEELISRIMTTGE